MEKIDLYETLKSFQDEFQGKKNVLPRARTDSSLFVYHDFREGIFRITCAKFDKDKPIAIVVFVRHQDYKGLPCLQLAYVVDKSYQGKGIAKKILNSSIEEISLVFRSKGMVPFYFEAAVDFENIPSQKIASACISQEPIEIIDFRTNRKSLQYFLNVE